MTHPAKLPADEAQRLSRLRALAVLDTEPEEMFDSLVRVAAEICGVPISLVSLIDTDRQWFKANFGLPGATETPRDIAFCAHAILGDEVMEIPDAATDWRFVKNPLVTGDPRIRFYAGAPLKLSDGTHIGTLCVIDRQPRKLTESQLGMLSNLAVAVVQGLEFREKALVAVEKLARDAARQTQLYAATPAMLHSIDASGCLVDVNDQWLSELGYQRDEVLGRRSCEFLTEASQKYAVELVLPEFFRTGRCDEIEYQMVRKDGSVIDVLLSAVLEKDEHGNALRSMAVTTNVTARKLAERALDTQARFTLAVLDNVLDGIVTIDAGGIIRSFNPAALRMFGYSVDEVTGRNVSMLMPEPDASEHGNHPRDHTTTGVSRAIGKGRELQGRRKDGTLFPLELSVSRGDQLGAPIFVGVMRDITLRKQQEQSVADAQRALADLNYKFQVATRASRVGVWEWNIDDDRLIWDDMMFALFGIMDRQDCLSAYETWKTGVHPDDAEQKYLHLARALRGEGDYDFEFRVVWPDASVHYLQARATVERDEKGAPIRMLGTKWDITEQRVAERALADLHHRFQAATRAARVGVWEWNVVDDRLVWDEMMYALYGIVDRKSFPGAYESWQAGLHPDDAQAGHMHIMRALSGEKDFDCEFRVVWPDGTVRHLQARAMVERDGKGSPTRMLGTNWDITEQRVAEDEVRASKVFLERTGSVAGVGGWEVDLRAGSIHWSDETCALHDLPPGYRPSMDEAIAFYAPEARPVIRTAVERAITRGERFDLELPFVSSKGRAFWARAVGNVQYEGGEAVRLVGAFQDITARKEIERRLAESLQLLQVTLESIGDAVITTDVSGKVEWLNPVAERLTGWSRREAQGRPLPQVFVIVNEDTREPAANPVTACLRDGKIVGLANHTTLISRSGVEFGIEDSASPIRDAQGNVHGAVLVFHDVSEQRRLSNEMSHRATHDVLTGLVNRREFETRLNRLLSAAKTEHAQGALMYIDLDQFKLVNDACGHSVGDQLLQQVSKLFQDCVRGRDTVARLGGDEFGIILEHCDSEQAQRVAQKICDHMEEFRFLHDGRRFRVGTSIGLVPVDNRWGNMAAVLQAADSSCYAAKDAGRNRVHAWYDTDYALKARHGEMQWVTRLEQALDENRFELFGQRIVPISEPAGGLHFEVLLRLREADGSLIPPGIFLPAAERFHLITRIDRWVVRRVFDWVASLGNAASTVEMVSINLSGQSVGDRAFHQHLIEKLANASFDTCKLCFEITETAAITNLADAKLFIEEIRRLGAKVALDDFGAGASSFGYLKTLPVDFLKIDGQFITELLDDKLDGAAVRCFRDVAKVMGLCTIAEFVESEDVLAELKAIGIDMAQGYLIHKPAPIAICAGLLSMKV